MTRHPSETETTLMKAARLAALALLDEQGLLTGRTLQEVADALNVGHRSTILKDKRQLPAVQAALAEAKRKLEKCP